MKTWRKTNKVHLSPSLAHRSGQNYRLNTGQIVTLLAAGVILVLILGHRFSLARSSTTFAQGQVLGASTVKDGIVYEVKPGDTLIKLSEKYQVYWLAIVQENKLSPPYSLSPGQKLIIPKS